MIQESVAASWKGLATLLLIGAEKHSHAVYVPSNKRIVPVLQYCYGHIVLVAEKTDPLFLLKAARQAKRFITTLGFT